MKQIINKAFPVLLAISLPGIGFFLSADNPVNTVPLAYRWIYTSVVIYLLWLLLATSWRFKDPYKQVAWLLIVIPVFFLVMSSITYLVGVKESFSFEVKEMFRGILLALILLTIQFNRSSQKKLDQLEVEKEQLSKEKYKAQLQSLRNQMDPHFLFNSLNTLRSMVSQNHQKSEEFILNLSDYYRSTLNHSEETLSLSEEITLLNSYLRLMQDRNDKALHFEICPGEKEFGTFRLPAFALQNVVENCIKHNSMSSKKPLHIRVSRTKDGYIEVSNTVRKKLTTEPSSGMGLKLLERRYNLLGITKAVVVSNENDIFRVKLKLINPQNERINS